MMGNRALTGATLPPPQERVDMLYYRNNQSLWKEGSPEDSSGGAGLTQQDPELEA